ncbi:flagellar protein FlaG [Paenibacillus sp. PAMC21692]|uniref:flagellar protein FlaG n=1 Tax=Paenibacillus sp. PAMC21692 TaxID=2762320 RepID=UPI00164DFF82|nr:flagellar protein FlaG [Paenibacillus sp. PAMC21692]QNK58359.1 flagellar protein FlaG [Paenibacillus sp. PAMC21692]
MLGSINRMDGANRDWNQANLNYKTHSDKASGEVSPSLFPNEQRISWSELNEVDKEKLYKEVERINNQLQVQNHTFRFKFSEEADQFYMQVIDLRTQEVVNSVPSEHMIELAAKLKEMIGFFIDEKR